MTEKLVDEIIASTEKYLYPNPNVRAKRRAAAMMSRLTKRHRDSSSVKHLPEAKLGETMTARLDALDHERDSRFRNALSKAGEAFVDVANLRHAWEESVTSNFIKPLGDTKKDISDIRMLRSKLEKRRLDYDCLKRKKEKGQAVTEDEVKVSEQKFQDVVKITRDAMSNFIERDIERITALRALKDEIIDFNKRSNAILEKLGNLTFGLSTPNVVATPANVPAVVKKENPWGDDGKKFVLLV